MTEHHTLEPGDRLCLARDTVALVVAGSVDALVVPRDGGGGIHLATVGEGHVVIALAGAVCIELSAPVRCVIAIDATAAPATIDAWIRAVEAVSAWTPVSAPRALFPGRNSVAEGEVVAAPREQVVWFRLDGGWRQLTDGAPIVWQGPPEAEVTTTAALAKAGELAKALAAWGEATAARLADVLAARDAARTRAMTVGAEAASEAVRAARGVISHVGRIGPTTQGLSPAQKAVALAVPEAVLVPSRVALAVTDAQQAARTAAVEAGLGTREVEVPGRLERDEGPPLVVMLDDGARAAAMRAVGGRYALFDPDTGRTLPRGTSLARRALALTPPLDAALTAALRVPHRLIATLARLSLADGIAALLMGLAGVALSAATPVATNLLFASIWPRADVTGHWLVIAGLAIAALASIGFDSARSARAGRVAMRFLNRLENGTWLALARARPGGLAGHTAGDLQSRLGAVGRLRQALLGQPMRLILDCAAMLTSGVLMVVYGGTLAWIGAAAVLVLLLMWSLLPRQAVRARTEAEEVAGRQTALLTQALAAIVKVKATASEPFLLARWARLANQHRAANRRAERIETAVAVTAAAVGGLSTAAVFAIGGTMFAGGDASGSITLGGFLAFQTSLGQTLGAAGSAASILSLWPHLSAAGARLAPLASVAPETEPGSPRTQAPALDGRVTISHVTHHYPGVEVPSLRDVDIDIAARDYAAIVGASGSGKSTLLRLILGVEQPSSGAVYFDGLDARRLDPVSVRRQFGYVGQDARLAPGSILDNILDGRSAGAPEAWAAARLAGIAEDIEAMPMAMHTLVGEAGQNLSGGQRQRLMIARALLTRPRILIFDEATSALDNHAQAIVRRGLSDLPVTRIVVAHRLSTVMEVDRVFVLDRGRVVETGPPAALLRQGGAFAALANRQRVEAS